MACGLSWGQRSHSDLSRLQGQVQGRHGSYMTIPVSQGAALTLHSLIIFYSRINIKITQLGRSYFNCQGTEALAKVTVLLRTQPEPQPSVPTPSMSLNTPGHPKVPLILCSPGSPMSWLYAHWFGHSGRLSCLCVNEMTGNRQCISVGSY